ncbi:MAG: ABC transporter permease [Acetobacteraceae bacterium]
MRTLDRKLLRDLSALRGQVVTIALLIAAGVSVLVMSVSGFLSLRSAQRTFYDESRFAEIQAEVKRAPRTLLARIGEIPGVATAEARIAGEVRIDWPGAEVPVAGRVLSLPATGGQPVLNRLHLLAGRLPEPTHHDEVVIHVAFAEAWHVGPGDEIAAILNGRREQFRITGIAYSPEFVFTSRPGSPLPDDRGFAVLWAGDEAVARAFDMRGAFNEVLMTLAPAASEFAVIAAVDDLLRPWGGRGAYGRRDQPSHRFLEDELAEQRTLAVTVPLVFFGIAAFLMNVVLGRMVEAQREQVAALKALGYPSLPIALHYAKFVALVCGLGSVLGIATGVWMGAGMLGNYRPFFRFPEMPFLLPGWLALVAPLASFLVALLGVLTALRRILGMPAAEGLRPARPLTFGGRTMGRLGHGLRASTRIPIRRMLGRPFRTLLTILGIAMAVPMVVLGLFWWDAMDSMAELQFDRIERADAVVALTDPRPARAVREIAQLPGVLAAEGQRIVPVRLLAAQRSRLLALTGLADDAVLRVPRDAAFRPLPIPPTGLAISRRLAVILDVREGDIIQVEVLEGARRVHDVPVAALIEDTIGLSALMEINALNRLMREDDLVSHVALSVDPREATTVWKLLAERPRVAATSVKAVWLLVFNEVVAGMILISAATLTGFGMIIAVGVVYNSARVSLQEQAWETASLRVLGFTRKEVRAMLLAELVPSVLVAVPLGLLLARWIIGLILNARDNETFQIPAAISPATLAISALIVLGAALLSAMVIKRRIDQLDLVAALKARD